MKSIKFKTFNSRPHKEVDAAFAVSPPNPCTFNSRPHKEVDQFKVGRVTVTDPFQFTTSQGGRQQIPTNIANICINSSLFCTPHPFLHTFILQFRITFPLCYSYIQCESLGIFCPLYIRTKELTAQSHQNWALFQYAPLCFYTYLPDYKIADCPIPCL